MYTPTGNAMRSISGRGNVVCNCTCELEQALTMHNTTMARDARSIGATRAFGQLEPSMRDDRSLPTTGQRGEGRAMNVPSLSWANSRISAAKRDAEPAPPKLR